MTIKTVTISIMHFKSEKCLATFKEVPLNCNIRFLKEKLCKFDKQYKYERCSLRLHPREKSLADTYSLSEVPDTETGVTLQLYYKDLGYQIGWSTVFICEYIAPPIIYALVWFLRQPSCGIYLLTPMKSNLGLRQLALCCYVGHFVKRLLETKFVHRFSHATMPLINIFKNCSHYWLFALAITYFTNHPLYTPPTFGMFQVYVGLGIFMFGEIGNLSTHLALKNLRPAGSTVRRIPVPVPGSPFTKMFLLVACPNYLYEAIAWLGFAVMTQTLPAAIFFLASFGIMSVWALAKLRVYRKEFPNYPRKMKAIIPFVL